ncbi:hypothetical protein E4665_13955 [Sporolactobacillus shoreae]|uniref:Uncharacterized protein n=1 Tax=Sporolactobacillus shoreae TaxID=1465501 RepID=A0A4Z0GJ49_9BACL|nr:hypothetical protein [Sporolactobacillus shoreae]TGA96803.1 hypothetical protein E4665_13955 [Sporolactobacillus shoreae]
MSLLTHLYLSVSLEPNNYNLSHIQSFIMTILISVIAVTSLLIIILIWSLIRSFSNKGRHTEGRTRHHYYLGSSLVLIAGLCALFIFHLI